MINNLPDKVIEYPVKSKSDCIEAIAKLDGEIGFLERLARKNKKYWSFCDNLLVAKHTELTKRTNEKQLIANLE